MYSISSSSFYFTLIPFLCIIIFLIVIHLQRPAETLHFYQTLIGGFSIVLNRHAELTYKMFWFVKPPLIEISSFEEFKRKSYLPIIYDTYKKLKPTLDTGDLVLFGGDIDQSFYVATKWACASPINHVGIVYKEKDGSLKIFESNFIDGVNILDLKTKIQNYPSEIIAVRRLKDYHRTDEFYGIFNRFIEDHYGKPHDLNDLHGKLELVRSGLDLHIPFTKIEVFKNREEKIEKLFCSELTALLFSKLGFLNLRVDNELLTSNDFIPADFSNYCNYTRRNMDVEKKALFQIFEDEIFILKKDKYTLVE